MSLSYDVSEDITFRMRGCRIKNICGSLKNIGNSFGEILFLFFYGGVNSPELTGNSDITGPNAHGSGICNCRLDPWCSELEHMREK